MLQQIDIWIPNIEPLQEELKKFLLPKTFVLLIAQYDECTMAIRFWGNNKPTQTK